MKVLPSCLLKVSVGSAIKINEESGIKARIKGQNAQITKASSEIQFNLDCYKKKDNYITVLDTKLLSDSVPSFFSR